MRGRINGLVAILEHDDPVGVFDGKVDVVQG
jgi:hypothetical protein